MNDASTCRLKSALPLLSCRALGEHLTLGFIFATCRVDLITPTPGVIVSITKIIYVNLHMGTWSTLNKSKFSSISCFFLLVLGQLPLRTRHCDVQQGQTQGPPGSNTIWQVLEQQ